MVLRSRVTLRGLWVEPGPRVPTELCGVLIPWESVLPRRMFTDDRGRIVRRRVPVELGRFPTEFARHIAWRAQRRALRARWADHRWSLTDEARNRRTNAVAHVLLAGGSLFAAVWIARKGLTFYSDLGALGPLRQHAAGFALLVLAALFAWVLLFLLSSLQLEMRLLPIESCTISPQGLSARVNGRNISAVWPQVRFHPTMSGPVVSLTTGEAFRLPPRIANVLRYRPPAIVLNPQVPPRTAIIWIVLGTVIFFATAGAAVYAADPAAPGRLLFSFLTVPIWIAMLLLMPTLAKIQIRMNRYFHKKIRLAQRASRADDPPRPMVHPR